jgi:glycogen(starch) synthase
MNNLNILIQHPHRGNEISGVMTYVNLIASELSSRPGIAIQVISSKTTTRSEQIKKIQWADIVHLNSNDPLLAITARVFRKRVVLKAHYLYYQSVHDNCRRLSFGARLVDEVKFISKKSGWFSKHTRDTYIRLAARLAASFAAHEILTCSDFLKESMSLPRTVKTAYYPITTNGVSEAVPSAIPTFVFLGRLNNDKGCDLLVEACFQIKEEGHRFKAIIVGDGEDLPMLKQMVNDRGLSSNIEFRGRLSQSDAVAEIGQAIALVQPARWQEPAGYTPLEAASLGKISIVAAVGGLPEMAGPMAFTFKRNDVVGLASCLREVINGQEDAIARGKSAYERVRQDFSAERAADEFLEFAPPRR